MIWPQANQPPHLMVQGKFTSGTQSQDGYTALAIRLYETHETLRISEALYSILFLLAASAISAVLYIKKPERLTEIVAVLCLLSAFYWLYFQSLLQGIYLSQGTYGFLDYNQGTYYKMLALQIEKGSWGVPGGPIADWAYYNGTNYLYFGPFPALVWLVIKRATLTPPTFSELTLICAIINLEAFYILIRKSTKHFEMGEEERLWSRSLFLVVYGLGPLYYMAGRYFIYETAIIFGSTFMIASLILFTDYLFLSSPQMSRKSSLLFLSSACLCLAFLVTPQSHCRLSASCRSGFVQETRAPQVTVPCT